MRRTPAARPAPARVFSGPAATPASALIGGVLAASALAAASPPVPAAEDAPSSAALAVGDSFELSVQSIMRGPELVGQEPDDVRWTEDGRWIYFRWKPGGTAWDEEPSLYRVRVPDGAPEELSEEEADSLAVYVAPGDLSRDGRRKVVAHQGDLWLLRTSDLELRRLTDTRTRESSPVFGASGEEIYFVREDDLFSLTLRDGALRQLTDIRKGPEQEEPEPAPQEEWLQREERELIEHVRREAEEQEEEEAERERRRQEEPEPIRIGQEERVSDLAVEARGRHAVITVSRPAKDARQTLVPDYVTESGYSRELEARPKVGDAQGESRLGWVELATGEVRWLELAPGADSAGDAAKGETAEGADGDAARASGPAPADSATASGGIVTPQEVARRPELAAARFLGWSEDGSRGLVAAVSYDYRNQWLWSLDAATGELALVARDHDEAWIGGPCAPWIYGPCAGWMPDDAGVYFTSERSGWSQLYRVDADGTALRRLTRGDWEVHGVELSADEESFLLQGQGESPFSYHLYALPLEGGELTRITGRTRGGPGGAERGRAPGDGDTGRYEATASPDGKRLAVVHSRANRPPDLYVMRNRPGAAMRRITDSPTGEWTSGPWIEPEIVWLEARDGEEVPARIYRPADLGAEASGAGVIFVHGAGYLHNVHRWWSSYYREYMFHHLLAARGYVVLDIDYRGSAGYGRDWRTAVYRHMGGKDLTDQVDGARYLARSEGVDPERIGIYGGSYGGFITLMALFKHPETFAAGAALRSVTDWAHYNHWYTSRILNLPQDDSVAYRRSSPIYFAEGLEDPLLIAHGMVDTNVHFQDVVRLAQRLIELGKEDWEMAVYPVEPHGFLEPASWTDEYRRILEIFEENLR